MTTTTGALVATQPSRFGLRVLRRALSVASTMATAAVLAVALLAVVVALADRPGPGGQRVIFGHPTMSVLSGSMTPVIRTGDLVVDHPVTPAQTTHLRVGQIISFSITSGASETHRIVGVVHQADGSVAYRTKGDANNAADTTLRPAGTVIGVYSARIPYGGYVLNALHHRLVTGLLAVAVILGLVSSFLLRSARRAEQPLQHSTPAEGNPAHADITKEQQQ